MYYKLTNQDMQTFGGMQWQLGEWGETDGQGDIGGPGWLHVYSDPTVAVLLNPIHANFAPCRLFTAEGEGAKIESTSSLQTGFTRVRLVEEVACPGVTIEQRVRAALMFAHEASADEGFRDLVAAWLSGAPVGCDPAASDWALPEAKALEESELRRSSTWFTVEGAAATAANRAAALALGVAPDVAAALAQTISTASAAAIALAVAINPILDVSGIVAQATQTS